MKLKPIGGKVILHPIKHSEVSAGGLALPGNQKKRDTQGVIVAKGPLCSEDIQIGDLVYFNPYSGESIVMRSGGEFVSIPEEHLIGVRTDSDIVLMDTETVKRLLEERKHELMQRYVDDIEGTKLVRDIFESIRDRVDNITVSEGMEW